MPRARKSGAGAAQGERGARGAMLLLGGFSLLLLLACLAGTELAFGVPALAPTPLVDIYTPTGAPPFSAALADQILPTTPGPIPLALAAVRGATLGEVRAAAAAATPPPATTATGAAGTGTPTGSGLQPTFDIAPKTGLPGSTITISGRGWVPDDIISIRLQDPANPQTQQLIFQAARTGSDGTFNSSLKLPDTPPWATLTAMLLWAVSSSSGVQAAAPAPFIVVRPTPSPTASETTTPAVETSPTSGASATSLPPATEAAGTLQSTLPTSTPEVSTPTPETAGPTVESTPTSENLATPPSVFQSPLATPTTQPPPSTAPVPNRLPKGGQNLFPTAHVTTPDPALQTIAGQPAGPLARLQIGALLGVLGEDPSGGWLFVMDEQGHTGWVSRGATDFSARVPVASTGH